MIKASYILILFSFHRTHKMQFGIIIAILGVVFGGIIFLPYIKKILYPIRVLNREQLND